MPVGEDQRRHLELARDICRRVHDQYGKGGAYKKRLKRQNLPTYPLFTEPQALILNGTTAWVMRLTDGTKKMSKSDPSDNSRINLLDLPPLIRSKIKSAKTDSGFDHLGKSIRIVQKRRIYCNSIVPSKPTRTARHSWRPFVNCSGETSNPNWRTL